VSDNRHFDQLVASGKPVGEVIAFERFLVRIRGLSPINAHALVMFEDGSKGFVHHVLEDQVLVLHLGNKPLAIGMTVVVQHDELVTKVGKDFIGRVISVSGEPLDGKGPIAADSVWPIFSSAPPLIERELLDTQLATGVSVIDTLFPLVRGQRLAIMGDNKAGKSSLAMQLTLSQKDSDIVVVYVLIAKRRSDVDALLQHLHSSGALSHTIVVVATMFESLIMNYLAPYVGCSLGEYLWQRCDQDVLVIYDDLTSHAQAHREVSLLSGTSPGRDSYPGDIFYAHSTLLERAGRLNRNHKTLTAVPLVLTPGGDITAFLPTNIMSISDGQWILDMAVFRDAFRPAIHTGLSVTRVGGRGHNDRQKKQADTVQQWLAAFLQAEEYAHFGSELAIESQKDLEHGRQLYELFNQKSSEVYSVVEQQLLLEVLLGLGDKELVDITRLKANVAACAAEVSSEADMEKMVAKLKAASLHVELTKAPEPTL
jgi:F-type H+-transporting ATPase subunit alpha